MQFALRALLNTAISFKLALAFLQSADGQTHKKKAIILYRYIDTQ